VNTRLALALLPVAFVVAGCVHNDRAEPPAELTKIDQTLDVRKLWSNKVGGKTDRLRLGLRPATDGARIFAGAHDGLVVSFDAQTGKKVWSTKTELPLAAGPAYGEDLLAFGTTDGDLVVLDANTGEQRWRVPVGSEVLAAPAIGPNVVVLRTVDGRLRGYSSGNGSLAWAVEQTQPALTIRGNTVPRVAGGFVVSGFNNGRVGAYNVATGETAWEIAIANPAGRTELDRLVDVGAGLSVVGNDVYVVGYQGRAVGIDLQTGVVLWQQDMSSYAGLGTDVDKVYVTSDFDSVIALDRRRGASLWRNDALRLRDVTAPTRYENTLVVGDFEGYVHWLDPEDGHFVAREHAAKARISGAPLVVGENVYVQSDDGTVAGYTLRDKDADKRAEQKGADPGA
jgi:outer membrane protein assembly factor BamB